MKTIPKYFVKGNKRPVALRGFTIARSDSGGRIYETMKAHGKRHIRTSRRFDQKAKNGIAIAKFIPNHKRKASNTV
jgi:hypothetical protein